MTQPAQAKTTFDPPPPPPPVVLSPEIKVSGTGDGAPQGDGGAEPVTFKGFQSSQLQTWKITKTSTSDSAQTEAATAAAPPPPEKPTGNPEEDAAAVERETKKDPVQGAKLYASYTAQYTDPDKRAEFIDQSGVALFLMGSAAGGAINQATGKPLPEEQRKQIIASVADAAEAAGPEGAARIAHSFAPNLQPNEAKKGSKEFNSFTDLISQVTAEGHGAALGVAISAEYNNRCDRVAGKAVMDATLKGVDHLRIDFEKAADEVDRLNDELAQRLAALGPGLTQAQQEEFAQKFKEEHAKAYDKKDKTGATLVTALRDLGEVMDNPNFTPEERRNVELQVKASLKEIPRLSETPEGLKFVTDQLAESGKGKFSWVDSAYKQLKDDNKFLNRFAVAVTKAAGVYAGVAATRGNFDVNDNVLKGLANNAELFGLSRKDMDGVVSFFTKYATATPQQQQALEEEFAPILKKINAGLPGSDPKQSRGELLKGLGISLSWASGIQNLGEGIDKDDWKKRMKGLGELVNASGDTVALMADIGATWQIETLNLINQAEIPGGLPGKDIAKLLGAGGSLLAATMDGLTAAESWKKGDKVKAGIYGASAIGNILATAGLVEETLGIAASFGATFLGATLTTIGSVVTVAALGFKIGYDLYKDHQFRDEQCRLLKELGFDDDKARGLANASPEYLQHLQSDLGFDPLQIQALAIKHPTLMSADYSAELPNLAQFAKVNGLSTQQVWQLLYGGFANTGDVTSFLSELTTVQGLSNVTADDYQAVLEVAARSDNPARARAAQAALDFLRNPPTYSVGIE